MLPKQNIRRFCITAIIIAVTFSIFPCSSYSNKAPFVFFDANTYVDELKTRIDAVAPAIIRITAYDNTGTESGSGSGFFIDNGGLILTNAHIFKNAYSAEVFTKTGRHNNVTILCKDEGLDLALIKINTKNNIALELVDSYETVTGDKLTVIGISKDLKSTVTAGTLKTIIDLDKPLKLLMIKPAGTLHFKLADNGPLLNADNKVIGLSTPKTLENRIFGPDAVKIENDIRAIHASTIKNFLAGTVETVTLEPPGSISYTAYIKKNAINGFIILYKIGSKTILFYLVLIVLAISLCQWIYYRLRNKKQPQG